MASGVVGGLVSVKVIVRAANLGDIDGLDYNLQPWAWDYLNENPQLLFTEEEIEALANIGRLTTRTLRSARESSSTVHFSRK